MLPPDWGRPHSGPRRLLFAKSGAALRERYRPLGRSRQLERVFANAFDASATAVFLDRPYIDLDYRSDLSHFYGRAFPPPSPATERLIFTPCVTHSPTCASLRGPEPPIARLSELHGNNKAGREN